MISENHRLPVTDQGVVIPREWLGTATEVTVRRENGHIVVDTLNQPLADGPKDKPEDSDAPIWSWGSDPITDDPITDGSINLDHYLYGADKK